MRCRLYFHIMGITENNLVGVMKKKKKKKGTHDVLYITCVVVLVVSFFCLDHELKC